MYYRGERTKQLTVVGATEQFAEARFAKVTLGRFFTQPEVLHRRRVVVLGETAYQGLFAKSGLDPIGKQVRIGAIEYTVVGVLEKAPSVGGFGNDQDDMVVIPQTTHQIMFSTNATRRRIAGQNSATIMIVPYAWATQAKTRWRTSRRSCGSGMGSSSTSPTTSTWRRRTPSCACGIRSAAPRSWHCSSSPRLR